MKSIIDTETGEILDDLLPGDRILRKRSIDYLKSRDLSNEELIEVNKGKDFVKIYDDVLGDLQEADISSSELAIILVALKNLSYISGAIVYKNTGEFLTPASFQKLANLSRASVFRSIDKLVEKGIFCRGKTGKQFQLFANPYIFMKGTKINKTLYDMFKNSRWHKKHKWEVDVEKY